MKLVDNNKYVNVAFRIESGYVWGSGHTRELSDKFNEELHELMPTIGFTMVVPEYSGCAWDAVCEGESLYCHPMELTGYVLENRVEVIAEALSHAKSFTLRKVDRYETAQNYTETELVTALALKKEKIQQDILNSYRSKFKYSYELSDLKGYVPYFKKLKWEQIEKKFIEALFEQLVEQGKIETDETGRRYRTIESHATHPSL